MKCKCGGQCFKAHQTCRHDVIVNEHGTWLEDSGIYDSETPYGPFTCMNCGQDYDELPKCKNNVIAVAMLKRMFSN